MTMIDEIRTMLNQISAQIDDLLAEQRVTAKDIYVTGVSEINSNMGLFQAGEVRIGNGVQPGLGFSGLRLAYPAMEYDSDEYHLAGVNNDVLQAGINANDGKLYAGHGVVELGENGISIYTHQSTPVDIDVPVNEKIVWVKEADTTSNALEIYGYYTSDSAAPMIYSEGNISITGDGVIVRGVDSDGGVKTTLSIENDAYINSNGEVRIIHATSDAFVSTNIVMDDAGMVLDIAGKLVLKSYSYTTTEYTLYDSDGIHAAFPSGTPKIVVNGGLVGTDSDNIVHTFYSTDGGTIAVFDDITVNYLVVGGGGGGGSSGAWGMGAGGGAGGMLEGSATLTPGIYTVTVGAGGASNTSGQPSSISGVATANGGGRGAGADAGTSVAGNGADGGCGGGGRYGGVGGTATAGQGSNGGGSVFALPNYGSGGGGGKNAAGASGTSTTGGNGGAGKANTITGASVTYAGGGGGGTQSGGTVGTGGAGGGGNAGASGGGAGGNGTDGLGGGGGGASYPGSYNGGTGGKGIVIISYTP